MDDGLGLGERLARLAGVGEIRDQALPMRGTVVARVHIQDVVAMFAQVAHDPPARLAASACYYDAHGDGLLAQGRHCAARDAVGRASTPVPSWQWLTGGPKHVFGWAYGGGRAAIRALAAPKRPVQWLRLNWTYPRAHGSLFADLRGYTDYVELHGDRAAADLPRAYRSSA